MVFIDLLLVIIVFIYLIQKKEISFLNANFLFLIFHVFFVSVRAYQILILDAKIIANYWYSEYITIDEIENALVVADFTLVGFTLGFNLLKNKFIQRGRTLAKQFIEYKEKSPKKIKSFIAIATFLGIFGTLSFAIIPGQAQTIGEAETNMFITFLSNLGVISALLLIYERGFKKIYLIYLFIILGIFSIQGYHRYRVILPMLFLMGYYLKVNSLKLPPLKYILLGFVFFVFSFPLKQIGQSIQKKDKIDLVEVGLNSFNDIVEGESGDLSFLEQSAAMIGSMEKKDKIFYGQTYVPIMFFWVPRVFWSSKPKLNQWQHDISSQGRDYGQMGQISLLSGESYANFRYLGAFVVPFFVGRIYSRVYYYYRNINIKHKGFLLLLMLNMILFQVWRDGVISLIVFPIVNYLPILLLIYIKKAKK